MVLEAMAMGMPGGRLQATAGRANRLPDESCGVLVSPDSREALIAGFAENMKTLARAPDLRERLDKLALRKRVCISIGNVR